MDYPERLLLLFLCCAVLCFTIAHAAARIRYLSSNCNYEGVEKEKGPMRHDYAKINNLIIYYRLTVSKVRTCKGLENLALSY